MMQRQNSGFVLAGGVVSLFLIFCYSNFTVHAEATSMECQYAEQD